MEANITNIGQAFTDAAGFKPGLVALGLYVVSFGVILVFGLFIVMKKANRGGDDEQRVEFFKIIAILIAIIIVFLLYSALSTT